MRLEHGAALVPDASKSASWLRMAVHDMRHAADLNAEPHSTRLAWELVRAACPGETSQRMVATVIDHVPSCMVLDQA